MRREKRRCKNTKMPTEMVEACRCTRCGHVWLPSPLKTGPPIACAKCKSPYWDVEPGTNPRGRPEGYRKEKSSKPMSPKPKPKPKPKKSKKKKKKKE